MSSTLTAKKREDYRPSAYSISKVNLTFELSPDDTLVKSTLNVSRDDQSQKHLILDGEGLMFKSLAINGKPAMAGDDYELSEAGLSIVLDCDEAVLDIVNTIAPASNTSLEGLYYVSDAFCTQCEAEGFRKITYFLDRPDVLSIYTVTIISDNPALSYLLSNGNKMEDTILDDGRRKVVWHDPHYKPCYLFALVAGHFDLLEDSYTTSEGITVALQIYVDEGRLHQAHHAMASLKKSMQWDEQTFSLAYDLDIYMIVAVDFFNMGAMENKGLNVFNSKFVLAEPSTATDEDYFNIESIIAHEYFHNWTGNRVTCRDWFQLSLKEGLTVFRDQKFSADMGSALACRIKQVKVMREHQFAEDAGPMSHPIRPDVVMEMNNFYTVTVYDKGAEVIRMLHTLLTPQGFNKGMALYFERHDGHAVTCDDFVQAMQDANDIDLAHFRLWYSQSGTPLIKVTISDTQASEAQARKRCLSITQVNNKTADQDKKSPLFIPITLSLLDPQGNESYIDEQQSGTFVLDKSSASIELGDTSASMVPVLLSDFSAPVQVEYEYSDEDILHIIRYAASHYAKWDASQKLYTKLIQSFYFSESEPDAKALNAKSADANISDITTNNLQAQSLDKLTALVDILQSLELPEDVLAQMLTLPSFETLSLEYEALDPLRLLEARESLFNQLSLAAYEWASRVLKQQKLVDYQYQQNQVNVRSLLAVCLCIVARNHSLTEQDSDLLVRYKQCNNMTDRLAILRAAQQSDLASFDTLMQYFEQDFGHDAVVMDKWFSLHATAERPDILSRLDLLNSHSQYSIKNPNKVRALVGSFAFYNTLGFHAKDGSGYRYLCDYLLKLDKLNPQVASRLITPMLQLSRYNSHHSELIRTQLHRLFGAKDLSKDLFEKLSKTLSVNT